MASKIDELRTELISDIRNLIERTEGIYLSLASEYPKLLKATEDSIKSSARSVQNFAGLLSSEKGADSALQVLLESSRSLIENASEKFLRLNTQDEELFALLQNNIEKTGALKEVTREIREHSEEMELISLNAMTTAIKAGKEGGAFSYITEELKRLSEQTIGFTDKLSSLGENLQEFFLRFKESVVKVETIQETFHSRFKDILERGFSDFSRGLSESLAELQSITDKSKTIKEPLFGIMQEVQNQDIIKQSLDHVVISLNEFKSSGFNGTVEDGLDEAVFLNNLSDLSLSILEEVSNQLDKSLVLFSQNTKTVEDLLQEAEKRRKDFLRDSLEAGSAGSGNITRLFQSSETIFFELISNIKESLRHKSKIQSQSRQLVKQVKLMSEGFASFTLLIPRYHNINVASKIEVAKQSVLKDMRDTILEMTSLTGQIETKIGMALKTTKGFLKSTKSSIHRYEQIFQEEEVFVDDFSLAIKTKLAELGNMRDGIILNLRGFQLYTEQFYNLFSQGKQELLGLASVRQEMDSIRPRVEIIKNHTSQTLKEKLESSGKDNWQIVNKKLQEIINGFTIYTHKKFAGDIGGFEVETGAEEGEVTFF